MLRGERTNILSIMWPGTLFIRYSLAFRGSPRREFLILPSACQPGFCGTTHKLQAGPPQLAISHGAPLASAQRVLLPTSLSFQFSTRLKEGRDRELHVSPGSSLAAWFRARGRIGTGAARAFVCRYAR